MLTQSAFLQSHQYDEDEIDRYLTIKEHKDAVRRVFKQLGSFYGQKDASARWFLTLVPELLKLGFVQGSNDKCVFRHPVSKIRVAIHVDDFLVVSKNPYIYMSTIQQSFKLRTIEDSPTYYLGT